MIHLEFEKSRGLAAELEIHDKGEDRSEEKLKKLQRKIRQPEDFYKNGLDDELKDLSVFLRNVQSPLKILDIGFGSGRSTLYMASLRHSVSGLEPSLSACLLLEGISAHVGLPLRVFQGPAEAMNQIPDEDFDLIVFNSSFHHCDSPLEVLELCHQRLKRNGRIFLNEPVLKPFRTKSWFFRMLKEEPTRMGHYGGNEHIYYSWEYRRLLHKAGFSDIEMRPSPSVLDLRKEIKRMAQAQVKGEKIYSRPRLFLHALWNSTLVGISAFPPLRRALLASSLMPLNFVAHRR